MVEDCLWADCLKVLFFFLLFFFLFQEDESLSIDWEDRLPSYSQKLHVNICYMEILENVFPSFPIIDADSPQYMLTGCHSYWRQWKNTAE